jgi:hypothetical protein
VDIVHGEGRVRGSRCRSKAVDGRIGRRQELKQIDDFHSRKMTWSKGNDIGKLALNIVYTQIIDYEQ